MLMRGHEALAAVEAGRRAPSAVSVLPTPLGPTKSSTPMGVSGLRMPAWAMRMISATVRRAGSCPRTRSRSVVLEAQHRRERVAAHLAHGDARPARPPRAPRRPRPPPRGPAAPRPRSPGQLRRGLAPPRPCRRRLVRLGRRGEQRPCARPSARSPRRARSPSGRCSAASAVAHGGQLRPPASSTASASHRVARRRGRARASVALALQGGRSRCSSATSSSGLVRQLDLHAGGRGVEQVHRLVRELAAGDVAVRQRAPPRRRPRRGW